MPKRILILGILFCVAGVMAGYQIIDEALHGRVNLNLAVFMLLTGIALLQGKRSGQWWARFWMILSYCCYALIAGAALIFPQNATANLGSLQLHGVTAAPLLIGIVALFAGLTYLCHRLLCSKKANAFFERKELERREETLYPGGKSTS